MREFSDVGRLASFGDDVNEAYRTYASAYLDFYDDNMRHFLWRNHDVEPMNDLPSDASEEAVREAYIDAAVDIIKGVLSGGYFSSLDEVYKEYPLLKERSTELEAEFYSHDRNGNKFISFNDVIKTLADLSGNLNCIEVDKIRGAYEFASSLTGIDIEELENNVTYFALSHSKD